MVKEFGMIAGGTGITPMFQVIKAILTNPADKTKVKLIYANVSEDDILLKEELDQLAKDHSEQFSIYYVLNNPPSEWDGGVGFVTKDMIEERFMKASQNVKVLLCGPPPMIKAMSQYCEELSYDKPRALSKMEDMVFKF
jgi:cytochrome-b5 reductase